MQHDAPSRLAATLAAGRKVLTGEVAPPRGADLTKLLDRARAMAEAVDAINVTDNQRAIMRMGNLAVGARLVAEGIEPILQLTCRDRNRLALQSDLLAAAALGVCNVLALTGDPVKAGNQPEAKAVFDLSSVKLLETMRALAAGTDLAGQRIEPAPRFFPGAVVNPNLDRLTGQIRWLRRKAEAGAAFIQTQAIFAPERFLRFLAELGPFEVPILAGLLIPTSARSARFLRDKVPGIVVPDEVVDRLERAADPREEGMRLVVELAEELWPHVQGIHLMSVGKERTLAEVARELRHRLDFTPATEERRV